MSKQTIYNALRAGGLSPVGACAMMGNMWAESGLKSNIVEKRCSMSDTDYTYNVDSGIMPLKQFKEDSYGYGLCQWTYYTRKEALYLYAKQKGVSISDEQMQCEFCLSEMLADYPELYEFICTTDDLPTATKRICAEFERPQVNNFAVRINEAQKYYNELAADDHCAGDACPIDFAVSGTCNVPVRILKRGELGRDVFLLQCGLNDMGYSCGIPDGDFGEKTETAVTELRQAAGIPLSGIADAPVWALILKKR